MKSFEKLKKEVLEKIKEKQKELIDCDINNKEYTNILSELELLNLEYKEISSLNEDNFSKKLEEYKKIKSKYYFLEKFDMEHINEISSMIRKINSSIKEAYNNGVQFSELTEDYKQELLRNGIDYTQINNSETLNRILELLTRKYEKFKTDTEEFYTVLKNFSPYNYEKLKTAVENNEFLSIDILNEFRGIGNDKLIDTIITNYEKKKRIKKELLFPGKKEEMIDVLDRKTHEYINLLFISIGLFIKENYKIYKKQLGLTIDEYKEEDIVNLYSKILNEIADKNTQIKFIVKSYSYLLKNYRGFEQINNKQLTDLGLDLTEIKNSGTNIYELTKEDIFEILSKIKTYNNLQNEKTIDDTPKLVLATEE